MELHAIERRKLRDEFVDQLVNASSPQPGKIFSAEPVEAPCFLTVILALDWPTIKGKPLETRLLQDDLRLAAIAASVFRVKDFLERQLFQKVSVLEIKPGCVTVKFGLSGATAPEVVTSAVQNLLASAANFDVISAVGHVHGRSIKV